MVAIARRLPTRWMLAVGVALVLIALDQWLANREADRLLDRIEASEEVMVSFKSERAIVEAALEAFKLDTADGSYSEEELANLQAAADGFSAASRTAKSDLATAAYRLAEVNVLPWHRDLAEARAVYLDHNQAWQDVAEDILDGGDAPDLNRYAAVSSTWQIAGDQWREAIPWLAVSDETERRVERIFSD